MENNQPIIIKRVKRFAAGTMVAPGKSPSPTLQRR